MSFLGINASEFLILVVLAVIFFGPERIPEFSRKAARVIFYVRNIANGATQQLKEELGPEYQDLTLEDLNPRTFVQKHLLDDIQADLDGIKNDLNDVRREVGSAAGAATAATAGLNTAVRASGGSAPGGSALDGGHAEPAAAAPGDAADGASSTGSAEAADGVGTPAGADGADEAVRAMEERYGLCFDLEAT